MDVNTFVGLIIFGIIVAIIGMSFLASFIAYRMVYEDEETKKLVDRINELEQQISEK